MQVSGCGFAAHAAQLVADALVDALNRIEEYEESKAVTYMTTWERRGLEKGREEGSRQVLLRLLGARFGPLSEDVKRRVEAIGSAERLNQIADQILVAHSLEELGLGS